MAKLKTHCKNNHELTPDSVRLYGPTNTWRLCLKCKYENDKKQRDRPGKREEAVERGRRWRKDNLERSRSFALKNYDIIRDYIAVQKGFPCVDCGVSYPPYVMDFDHRDPSAKIIDVARARSIETAKSEIAKCDLVCSNCHRERTWKENYRGRTKQNCS